VIVDVEVIFVDLARLDLQVPVLILADGGQDARRFPCFDDGDHLIRLRSAKQGLDEIVASIAGTFLDFYLPLPATFAIDSGPRCGTSWQFRAAHHRAAHRVDMAVRPEEPDDSLWRLEGLDDGV
jgi:hypothetical protein